jgi:thymidylate synthase
MPPSELASGQQERGANVQQRDESASSPGFRYPVSAAERVQQQHEEYQYLNLITHILHDGESRPDRTGTGTLSLFAPPQMRFSLRKSQFPLLTTKRVFFRAVVEELLWFVKGDTNALHLSERGVKIWDGNGSREYLDSIGLEHRRVGDLGPVYGFQWRHFGAEYMDCDADYTGQGVDQLAEVIHKIKNNPFDRRIIMSAWNPAGIELLSLTDSDMKKMALPPCHLLAHFYVKAENLQRPELSCLLYQRSCDMGLGVPFNIASYALLTRMIAHVCDMDPGELIHTMGDAHVYKDHIDSLKIQLQREPRDFPTLSIARKVTDINDFKPEDFVVENYTPHGKIVMQMSV